MYVDPGQIKIGPTILSGNGTWMIFITAYKVSLQNGFGAFGKTEMVYVPGEGQVTVMLFGPTIGNGLISGEMFQVNPFTAVMSVVKKDVDPTHACGGGPNK